MSIRGGYQKLPTYLAIPGALGLSCVVSFALAIYTGVVFDIVLGKLRHDPGNLSTSILASFYVAPSVALANFVFLFTYLVQRYHTTSWRTPAFALAVGISLMWFWGRDWLGLSWYLPGVASWLVACWLIYRKVKHTQQHVLQA